MVVGFLEMGVRVDTPKGEVIVEHRCPAGKLAQLEMGPGLGIFCRYNSEQQLVTLVKIAARPDSWVTIARADDTLIGYVTFHPPSAYTRWGKRPIEGLLTLGGIEISTEWRRFGIARAILDEALADPVIEDLIIIAAGMAEYWDTDGAGLTTANYRAMLASMFFPRGFRRYKTDEPDMASYTGNFLVARIGSRVPPERVRAFEDSLFQSPPTGTH
jgi:acetoin utilization protein AcuA